MDCLDENRVLQYVAGLLSSEEQRDVDEHVARCDDCRWLLSAAGAALLDEVPSADATKARASLPSSTELSVIRRLHQVLEDTYVLERVIGMGGSGIVYEASHRRLPRRFAVKLLYRKWASKPDFVARLKREAEITSSLSHPNIVEVIDFNHSKDGTPFLVMELLQGESLAHWLRGGHVADLATLVSVVEPVASALAAAHAKGVVHRDLKPSNVFLSRRHDGSQLVKVVDFGIAKVVPYRKLGELLDITRVGAALGTPNFMSPEQADGRSAKVDHRADIFSLGGIMFQMMSGTPPFSGASVAETLKRVSAARPNETAAWRAAPSGVRDVVLRALSKDPARRQQSMSELRYELELAVKAAGKQVTAGVSGSTPRVPPRASPRRARVWAALALMAVASFLLGLALWRGLKGRPATPPHAALERVAVVERQAVSAPETVPQSPPPGLSARPAVSAPLAVSAVPAASAAPAASHKTRSASVRRKAPALARAAASPASGSLAVQSKTKEGRPIWANVFVDGRLVGQTALTLGKIAAGRHRVDVRRAGYLSATREVRVRAGRRTQVGFELQPVRRTSHP